MRDKYLTPRETEIIKLLSDGKLYKEIAYELTVNIDTVKKHCGNIYKKLGVRNKVEAILKYKSYEQNQLSALLL